MPDGNKFAVDRLLHASQARLTGGLSPASIMEAYFDWAIHLANSPGKQAELFQKALRKSVSFHTHHLKHIAGRCDDPCIYPLPQDKRFRGDAWKLQPYASWYQSFLLVQQWWHNATTNVAGVSQHHQDMTSFAARQILDIFSPSNYLLTNPEVLEALMKSGGGNLIDGAKNFVDDWQRAVTGAAPHGAEAFKPGVNVAITPGKVVYRNALMELIQYSPTTKTVHADPVLIVPAWIMKYYILDLSPHNSMVKYLVDKGHTVFMISWKNPTSEDRNRGFEDYIDLGVMHALKAIGGILPKRRVHAVGYCIGGTLLTIAAAALGQAGDERLKSITLFAAQIDFTEAGELMLFIDQSQISYLEDMMWDQGYLDTKQMAGAFQILRSNDLIWSRLIHDYLMGERAPMTDLMAWNADATRMPYRMHSEYLHQLFLNNDFAEGRFTIDGQHVSLTDLRIPVFLVGAERDHVAPWESVYKFHLLADTDITFLLASGGHNAGIISEPGHPRRHYRLASRKEHEAYITPTRWYETAPQYDGSWWPAWSDWLEGHSEERIAPPKSAGNAKAGFPALEDAPGTYILME